VTPGEIEECKSIIRRWIAAGKIKVLPPLHPGMTKWHLTRERIARPLTAGSLRNKRRFSL